MAEMTRSTRHRGISRGGLACVLACLSWGALAAAPGNAPKGSFGELKVSDSERSREAPEMPAALVAPPRVGSSAANTAPRADRPNLDVAIDLPDMPAFAPEFQNAPQLGPPPVATISEPELVNRVEPEYPREALLSSTNGWVKVAFDVRADGRVENVSVVEANPPTLFNRAATRAVKRWRYAPSPGAGPDARRMERVIEFQAVEP